MDFFRNRLKSIGKVRANLIATYVRWVSHCHKCSEQTEDAPLSDQQVADYIAQLAEYRGRYHMAQACQAVATYRALYHQIQSDADDRQWQPLIIRLRHVARLKGLGSATIEAYTEQAIAFLSFWSEVSPEALTERHAMLYLSHLSGQPDTPSDTINHAYSGLSLFYHFVLRQELRNFVQRSAGWYHGSGHRKAG